MTDPRRSPRRGGRERVRASHSLEAVLSGAVEILDEAGPQGLTIRALAARLGGGPASVYWYVSGRDELLDLAGDSVLAGVLDTVGELGSRHPIDDIRAIAMAMFDTIADRPWLGAYAMRDTSRQSHSLRLYEKMGEQVMRLGMTPLQSFHATSAIMGFVIGAAADLGQEPPAAVLSGDVSREDFLAATAEEWRTLDAREFPFLSFIVNEFSGHDDRAQFRAGLELLLSGLELQASSAERRPAEESKPA